MASPFQNLQEGAVLAPVMGLVRPISIESIRAQGLRAKDQSKSYSNSVREEGYEEWNILPKTQSRQKSRSSWVWARSVCVGVRTCQKQNREVDVRSNNPIYSDPFLFIYCWRKAFQMLSAAWVKIQFNAFIKFKRKQEVTADWCSPFLCPPPSHPDEEEPRFAKSIIKRQKES